MRKMLVSLILCIMLVGVGCQGSTQKEKIVRPLKMGLIPADDAEEMLQNYEPIKEYLSEKLGVQVEIQVK